MARQIGASMFILSLSVIELPSYNDMSSLYKTHGKDHTMLTIKNGKTLLPNGKIECRDISTTNGLISSIGTDLRDGTELNVSGAYVLPGLIDIHTHGIGYESAWAGNLKEWAKIEASRGTTTFYPTMFSPPELILKQLQRHLQETDDLRELPQVQGFRLESPYLASVGGGLPGSVVPISKETTESLINAGKGYIKIWDLSPELPGSPDAIRGLSDRGIICSIAHTQCSIAEARAAVEAGAKLVTHLFDTFYLPEDPVPGVYPAGLVDYLLIEDRLSCEIIGDGTHVDPILVEKALRCKGLDRIIFTTDSNMGAGLPSGRYTLPDGWGDFIIDGPNNGVRKASDNILSGSALTPIDSFRNAIRLFNQDIPRASHLCSTNPARLLGLNKGEIAVGKDADFTIVDEKLEVLYTICAGDIIFKKR